MNRFGFVRLTCASPLVRVGHPEFHAAQVRELLAQVPDSDIVLFPELSLTGYTCGDLFSQQTLLDGSTQALLDVALATRGGRQLVVVGLPVAIGNSLFNCAAAVSDGAILGIVPKQFVPNYREFYESRWFSSAQGTEPKFISLGGREVPFGIDLLFEAGVALVGIEICEDLWMPIPPSSFQALAGANVLLNLSASNETVGKSDYRRSLVAGQSGRCLAAYGYASAGATESTTDLVFGGHCLIAENGYISSESPRVGDGQPVRRELTWITRDVDIERLQTDRRVTTSFDDCLKHLPHPYRRIPFELRPEMPGLERTVIASPFVPPDNLELHKRCAEIFGIMTAGLAKRFEQLSPTSTLNIGISGGLDSTLSLLVACKTCDLLGYPRTRIHGVTMPGFGTTSQTLSNALSLMRELGVTSATIDIRQPCLEMLRALGHKPFGLDTADLDAARFQAVLQDLPHDRRSDLVFENVQARMRTMILMSRGFVLGTGDLSESALGWSTYNGDHMSMYNPNCSVPKTLVRFLVQYVADDEFSGAARETLLAIVATPVSPELLPLGKDGAALQSTEGTLGPYELHDFFLYHVVRCGFSPEKILFLARHARFSQNYSDETMRATLRIFLRRFFTNQFKRSCVPDGPKVGTVSLSPRGDWRMPSDADVALWLASLDTLQPPP